MPGTKATDPNVKSETSTTTKDSSTAEQKLCEILSMLEDKTSAVSRCNHLKKIVQENTFL